VTLISSLITDAYREGNILPLRKVPDANQVAEALRLYNQNLLSIYGGDAGENLVDWPLGNFGIDDPTYVFPYTSDMVARPKINHRLIATNTAAITVYLTPYPQDGARMGIADPFGRLAAFPVTLDANGRTIEGAATKVLNANGTFQEWFYRADKGDWVKLTSLLSTDDNPFPADFDIFFYIGLALRLNPRYGREMDPQTAAIFKTERRQFVARYLQSAPLEINDSLSWPFMSRQGFDVQRGFSSNSAFNRGWYGGP
jgi:hypothetical protein